MIQVESVDAKGVPVICPQCGGQLYTYLPCGRDDQGPTQAMFLDGDAVPLFADLAPQARDGFGWSTELNASECPHCGTLLFRIVAQFMDVEPSSHVENTFFFRDADRGDEWHFIGKRGAERWIVTRLDTPQGPLLEHEFGPFADADGAWIGADGSASCLRDDPLDMARDFLLERWDELRLMPKAIGLHATDPRGRSHAALVPPAAARAAAWAADRAAVSRRHRHPATTDLRPGRVVRLLRSMTHAVHDAGADARGWWFKRRCTGLGAMVRFHFGEDCVLFNIDDWQYYGGEIIQHRKTGAIFEVIYDDEQISLKLFDIIVRLVDCGSTRAVIRREDMPRLGREAIMAVFSWFDRRPAELAQRLEYRPIGHL